MVRYCYLHHVSPARLGAASTGVIQADPAAVPVSRSEVGNDTNSYRTIGTKDTDCTDGANNTVGTHSILDTRFSVCPFYVCQ